ncbi:MAG: hypothetical protein JWL77_3130 [Chthonomonadaceae bacterium]|nr:hypothetical protein [Chthonomonadaceae bacterium]
MKRLHSLTAIALTGMVGFTSICAPMAARASEEGKRNTAIGLGAAAVALLLTQKNKTPGLIAAGGAVLAASQLGHDRRNRDYDRYGDDNRFDRDNYDRNYRDDRNRNDSRDNGYRYQDNAGNYGSRDRNNNDRNFGSRDRNNNDSHNYGNRDRNNNDSGHTGYRHNG